MPAEAARHVDEHAAPRGDPLHAANDERVCFSEHYALEYVALTT